ncbi:hypothetical protein BDCR2A_01852 [Borrelia duttonii CR2A]|uniref:Uncharacterized protein n=1 Tax=Borrelia duttonii CR2A TaxID=1432657 RepID=W6TVY2_9SPIR|nr:hypothetical protein BDCR2A_01852 [Borrelia duttonii CR2A]
MENKKINKMKKKILRFKLLVSFFPIDSNKDMFFIIIIYSLCIYLYFFVLIFMNCYLSINLLFI